MVRASETAELDAPLTALPGVGPARATKLQQALGIRTVRDLLSIAPRRYETPAEEGVLADAIDGELLRVRVRCEETVMHRFRGRSTLRVKVSDDSEQATLLYFNQPYLRDRFPEGRELCLEGRVSTKKGLCLISPRVVRPEEEEDAQALRPVYPETEGIRSGWLAKLIAEALRGLESVPEPLPETVRSVAGVPALGEALQALHQPDALEAVEPARRRLAWGEVLGREVARLARRGDESREPCAREARVWERISQRIPFELTSDQAEVLAALRDDLASGKRMTRLLHGEVGSGKTAVAFALALAVAAEGGQVALLAPTEILARQHLQTFREWLRGAPLQVASLLGDDGAARRRDSLEALRHGTAAIAIGTHALYGSRVKFKNLSLVVFDEQHRFGVRQKAALLEKGEKPHVLTMTATPIPRTLAWAQYGALEPCVLRSRPGTGGRITTHVGPMKQWPQVAEQLRTAMEAGERAFVVLPRIDGADGLLSRARELERGAWAGIPIGVVHGRMPGSEVAALVDDFRAGRKRALLGTTVVEVGLDVPGVNLMVVLDAHRLGLASLHQLRGRLARGADASDGTCWLLGEAESLERLETLEACTDGFAVAQADLRERGPGALQGTRQHGRTDYRSFDPLRDEDLVLALATPVVRAFLESRIPAAEQE